MPREFYWLLEMDFRNTVADQNVVQITKAFLLCSVADSLRYMSLNIKAQNASGLFGFFCHFFPYFPGQFVLYFRIE